MAVDNTYQAIATTTLSSSASSIDFTSIPATYTDLVLVINGSTSTSTASVGLRFNSDSSANYSRTRILGDGTTASTERLTSQTTLGVGDWGTDRCFAIIHIMNYSQANTRKTVLSRSGTQSYDGAYVGLWRNTPAVISSVSFLKASANIASGTTATLYGIKAA